MTLPDVSLSLVRSTEHPDAPDAADLRVVFAACPAVDVWCGEVRDQVRIRGDAYDLAVWLTKLAAEATKLATDFATAHATHGEARKVSA